MKNRKRLGAARDINLKSELRWRICNDEEETQLCPRRGGKYKIILNFN